MLEGKEETNGRKGIKEWKVLATYLISGLKFMTSLSRDKKKVLQEIIWLHGIQKASVVLL